MNAGRSIRSMLAMTALASFALSCGGQTDPSEQVTEGCSALRVISDPGNPMDPATPPTRPPRTPAAPQYSDLNPDGSMRFFPSVTGSGITVYVNVTNVGNMEAKADSGTVNVGGYTVSGPLAQYAGGTATTAHTLNPGDRGFIAVQLPTGALLPCRSYAVQIDTTRIMQGGTSGSPNVFANDQARVETQCLEWNTPVTKENYFADSVVRGHTLMEIVSSQVVVRADGHVCSHCHYLGCAFAYCPPVTQEGSANIFPTDVINGRTWAGAGGYARSFMAQPVDEPGALNSKPSYLNYLVQRWIEDGERVSSEVASDAPLPAVGP